MILSALSVVVLAALAAADISSLYTLLDSKYGSPPPQPPTTTLVQEQLNLPPLRVTFEPAHQQGYGVEGHHVQEYGGDSFSYESEPPSGEPLRAALGTRLSAAAIIVKLIGWVLVHVWTVFFGAAATIAFCKLTSFCDLTFKEHAAEHFGGYARSLMTPERIAMASRIVDEAVDKFENNEVK